MIQISHLQWLIGTSWFSFEQLTWRIWHSLGSLQSRILKSGPEEITIEDTQDKLRDHFKVIEGRSSRKAEKERTSLIKVIEESFQNENLTHDKALTVFFKMVQRNVQKLWYGHEAVECPDKRTDSDNGSGNHGRFQGKCFKSGTWGHKSKFFQKSDGKRIEKSNQAIDESLKRTMLCSDNAQPSCKTGQELFCTVDGDRYHSFTEHTWIYDTGSSARW